jgi:hypothetical protein
VLDSGRAWRKNALGRATTRRPQTPIDAIILLDRQVVQHLALLTMPDTEEVEQVTVRRESCLRNSPFELGMPCMR